MNTLEKSVLLKALENWITTLKRPVDAETRALFEAGDRKTVRSPEGVRLGTITVSDPKEVWKVTDKEAFTAWVAERYPDSIITTRAVGSAMETALLRDGVDAATGEVPDGIELRSATPSFTVKPETGLVERFLPELGGLLEIGAGDE